MHGGYVLSPRKRTGALKQTKNNESMVGFQYNLAIMITNLGFMFMFDVLVFRVAASFGEGRSETVGNIRREGCKLISLMFLLFSFCFFLNKPLQILPSYCLCVLLRLIVVELSFGVKETSYIKYKNLFFLHKFASPWKNLPKLHYLVIAGLQNVLFLQT